MANLCSMPDQWGSLPSDAAITNGLIFLGFGVICARDMGLQYRAVYNCFIICTYLHLSHVTKMANICLEK